MNTITLILVIATVVSGILWFFDRLILRPKRKIELQNREKISTVPLTRKEKNEILESNGWWGSLTDCFPYLLVVFLVRSFAYEPFRIPSASMMPTLLRGDFVLVDKFSYGIRNPFTNDILINVGAPNRGDVFVFKYPEDISVNYIKRVIGLPGDKIILNNNQLFIQAKGTDKLVLIDSVKDTEQLYQKLNSAYPSEFGEMRIENLLGYKHKIMRDYGVYPIENYFKQDDVPYSEWIVPMDSYFAMGDNRDHSRDSRFWGFVPNSYLVGRAVNIWFSFTTDDFLRISRIGGIE